ncbi:signal peptide peptidase SppA [Massilia sp. PAMC28688]|uniref:signal peptide peptidase SppA n=1 Tax=Massilia sp. PAMC28688 TaxID=2861283 RepID=UPI001C626C49|nr:signal peptide peptidase SppA [Massilia sp. PAMC28688]QYF92436.1 signal peptide peptidase SppA [Massilia sp. PAMC28688]
MSNTVSATKPKSLVRRGFGMLWRTLDTTRRVVLNLVFLLIVILLLSAIFGGGATPIGDKTALVLDLKGDLVEQNAGSVRDALMGNISGDIEKSVQLRDVLAVLDAAAKDKQISSVVLMLDEFGNAGLAGLHEVGAALERVKAAGKPVVAWGGSFDQKRYLLASHANELYMHPMGTVMIQGFGGHRNYYGDALDKLGVTVNLMKVGEYKSAAEPYISNGPSKEALEADAYLYNALWEGYTGDVEKNRKLAPGAIGKVIENLPALMTQAQGDVGKLALANKLVDGLKTRDELRDMMIKRGEFDDDSKSFRQVGFHDYLSRQMPKAFGDGVAVVVASGQITDGTAGPGAIGGLSTSNLIRKARNDDAIKAIVLRIDSPGGSPYGSELIRRELELARAGGKPVVVSMGNVAASGGYWVAMAADEVIADRSTITGSIGVFALLPTAEKVADKLGIDTAGHTTTWLAGAYNPLRPIDPRFADIVQSNVTRIYADFIAKAAVARKTTPAKINEVGQGRVWTGLQAQERGLVDTIGSFGDAIKSAAKRARLGDDFRIEYVEKDGTAFERFLTMFGASTAQAINIQVKLGMLPTGLPEGTVAQVGKDLQWLTDMSAGRQPFQTVTHCMCVAP